MSGISVYIPIYNGAEWCRHVELAAGMNYIASDNGSTDGSPEILEARGVQVIRQPTSLGRIGNWSFCLDHFRNSQAEWMKFLFVGDRLASNCTPLIQAAAHAHPSTDVLLFGVECVEASGTVTYRPADTPTEFTRIQALVNAAQRGNWFMALPGLVLRRNALRTPISFNALDWSADFDFAVTLASRCTIAGFPDTLSIFIAEHRHHHKKLKHSVQALIEETYVQERAIRFLEEFGYDGSAELRAPR